MIVRRRPSALGLLFILRGSIVPTIAPRVFVVLVLSAAVAWLHRAAPQYFRDLTPAPFTLLGLALSIFFGFRNNACYERWWEGRKQWGQLIAESRGLVREGVTLLSDEPAIRRRLAHRVIAFAHALRGQLRGTEGAELRDSPQPPPWPADPPTTLRLHPQGPRNSRTIATATDLFQRIIAGRDRLLLSALCRASPINRASLLANDGEKMDPTEFARIRAPDASMPNDDNALLRRRATAEALSAIGFPSLGQDAGNQGHSRRWPSIPAFRPSATVSVGRCTRLG